MMADTLHRIYTVEGMDCANCAQELEAGLARLPGVQHAEVDFATTTLRVTGDAAFESLQVRARALGKTLVSRDDETAAAAARAVRPGGLRGFWRYLTARRETQFALAGGALVLFTLALTLGGLPERAAAALYTVGMLLALWPTARSGIAALRHTRRFNINLLMSIAAVGAVAIGEHLEGAAVIFLYAIGEALEGYTADRARDSIRSLMALRPSTALLLRDGRETHVPTEALVIGDHIVVRPGDAVPMDGVIVQGASSLDQAPITGESLPVVRVAGDAVYAGSINGEGALVVRVTAPAADTVIARIIRLVEAAQSGRAPTQRVIDRFAAAYTPAVMVLAALVAVLPPLLFGAPFSSSAADQGWLYRALAMLVIACPCALVISTPVTVISAITAAARRGVLIKGGAHLEALAGVRTIAFDKTGTLTEGKPAVTAWRALDCATGQPCTTCDDVLALATAVERRTAHPLAQAVVQAARDQGVAERYPAAEAVEVLAGRGARGTVGGRAVTVGSHRLFDEQFAHAPALCAEIDGLEAAGRTAVLLADEHMVRGVIALADQPRPNAAAVVAELRALGLRPLMLTGDNAHAAAQIAERTGLTEVRAALLPADKLDAIRELAAHGGVAMVGDGVNDTPALAAATVGIAMGGAGSPQALETADIALMADDLSALPAAVRLARFARRLMHGNIALSIGLKLILLLLAAAGLTSLWAAIFADVGMSLLVTLNGMRPLRRT